MSTTHRTVSFPSFIQVLNKMFLIYKKIFFRLFAIIFLPVFLGMLFTPIAFIIISKYGGEIAQTFLLDIIFVCASIMLFLYAWSFVTFMVQISQISQMSQFIQKKHKNILQLYKESFFKTFNYIFMNLLVLIPLLLSYAVFGDVLFYIIYSISIVFVSMSNHILILEGKGIIQSLRQSILYAKDFFWHIAWKILLFFIFSNIITIIFFTPLYYYYHDFITTYFSKNDIQSIILMYHLIIVYPTFLLYMFPIYKYFPVKKQSPKLK
jgi:hypothetical protein